ncbi:carboxymuconolactone decarboxylase family protein [Rhodococcus sp. NPDC127530]|uniref:carboxymuconolactone decarboxylase family protein n=1 Tax=unclassified Rhodococcus (in: high G+C Gram-positive bacteria) TaxID=192944 RepID=UPI00363AC342
MIGAQALTEYRVILGAALTVGVTPVEVKEVVYQAVPYVGMGKVVDYLHATNDVLTSRGVSLPLPGQSTTTPGTREADGLALAVQKKIVGDAAVDRMYASAPEDEIHIQRFLSANCFGDHYTVQVSISPRANSSPCPFWPPWAGATHRSRVTLSRTSTSETTAHG